MADLKKLHEKFFTDPDWGEFEEYILEYIEPFRSVMNIPHGLSNDQIATEVRGRQLQISQLENMLADAKIVSRRPLSEGKISYK